MKEGEDYIIAQDPESSDESQWVAIILNGEFKDFIVKYLNLRIVTDDEIEADDISYDLEVIFVPEEIRDTEVTEEQEKSFIEYFGILIDHIVIDFHNRNINTYVDVETGEKVEITGEKIEH